mgnify:CR=1 FL=1
MLVKTYGSAVQGIDVTTATIEVNEFRGINFHSGVYPTIQSKKANNESFQQ